MSDQWRWGGALWGRSTGNSTVVSVQIVGGVYDEHPDVNMSMVAVVVGIHTGSFKGGNVCRRDRPMIADCLTITRKQGSDSLGNRPIKEQRGNASQTHESCFRLNEGCHPGKQYRMKELMLVLGAPLRRQVKVTAGGILSIQDCSSIVECLDVVLVQ